MAHENMQNISKECIYVKNLSMICKFRKIKQKFDHRIESNFDLLSIV